MGQKFADDARALLAGNITPTTTAIAVQAALADKFPVANTVDWNNPQNWFKVTIVDSLGNREVIKVGSRALGSGLLSNVLRAQEGTTALGFTVGAFVVLGLTHTDIEDWATGTFATVTATSELVASKKITQRGREGRIVPPGGIIHYEGSLVDIPVGWALCDGTQGTPDLRGRMIVGYQPGKYLVGATGGFEDAALPGHVHVATAVFTGTALPGHAHGVNDPGHAHGIQNVDRGLGFNASFGGNGASGSTGPHGTDASGTGISIQAASAGTPAGNVAVNVQATGVNAIGKNMPPFYVLALIKCLPESAFA